MCLERRGMQACKTRAGAGVNGALVSIFDETGGAQSAVAHDRSLELFCDGFEVIAHCVSLVNDDPPPRRLLYLCGMGGNGKSLLLRYLQARCCVRLPPGEWARLRRLPEAELPGALGGAAKAAAVPVAWIDFGARPAGENRPQECFSALFMLKRQLARYRLATPRFDFAAVTYLHKLGFLGRRLPELFPRSELGIALDLAMRCYRCSCCGWARSCSVRWTSGWMRCSPAARCGAGCPGWMLKRFCRWRRSRT